MSPASITARGLTARRVKPARGRTPPSPHQLPITLLVYQAEASGRSGAKIGKDSTGASLTTYSDSHFPLLQIDDLGCLALEHVL